jgi:hypothetical protein
MLAPGSGAVCPALLPSRTVPEMVWAYAGKAMNASSVNAVKAMGLSFMKS